MPPVSAASKSSLVFSAAPERLVRNSVSPPPPKDTSPTAQHAVSLHQSQRQRMQKLRKSRRAHAARTTPLL